MITITEVQALGGQILHRCNFYFVYKENLNKNTNHQELSKFWKHSYIPTKARILLIYYILSSIVILRFAMRN